MIAVMVATIVGVLLLLAVMTAAMLYGVFTERRR